jgi:hypothetical protein
MFRPVDDPDNPEKGAGPSRRRGVQSDRECPWCGSTELTVTKHFPSWRGPGILLYVFFPIGLLVWLSRTTYNECRSCGGRWQRGVAIEPRPRNTPEVPQTAPPPEERAGMYAEQVQAAAVVRRRARIGQDTRSTVASGDVILEPSQGACRACRQAGGRYDARDAPPIPVPGCTCELGCQCTIVPADPEPSAQ